MVTFVHRHAILLDQERRDIALRTGFSNTPHDGDELYVGVLNKIFTDVLFKFFLDVIFKHSYVLS